VFLLPLLAFAIGAFVAVSAGREHGTPASFVGAPARAVHAARPYRQVIYTTMQPACPPSPMAVLTSILANGQDVPPFVVECAIAEAEIAQRYDVAYALTQRYVIPALQAPALPAPAPVLATDPAPVAEPAVTSPDVDSPIVGVSDAVWSHFLGRLVREAPDFGTAKHVGRYRHHRARASEVGFKAGLDGDPAMQDVAMSADLADCFGHLRESGSLDACVGAEITIPDQPGAVPATLSGVLGVCSVAGLERAISWMENPDDRAAYPHTTMAFIRTNGAF
jgi:hypothetical protein